MATRAAMAAGSGSQLASSSCAARRHTTAKAARWSRFETKIAVSNAMIPSSAEVWGGDTQETGLKGTQT